MATFLGLLLAAPVAHALGHSTPQAPHHSKRGSLRHVAVPSAHGHLHTEAKLPNVSEPATSVAWRSALVLAQPGERMEYRTRLESPLQCSTNADCGRNSYCTASKECAVSALGESLGANGLMCVLAFVISAFSLAAGVGGGGLYVPLLMFTLAFDTHKATALSQAMLCGGAAAALVYNIRGVHPRRPARPLINFELACLMGAALMSGAQVGAVFHAISPTALVVVLLCAVLTDAARKSVRSALKLGAQESKSPLTKPPVEDDARSADVWSRSFAARRQLLLLWAICVALVVCRGLLMEICSPLWWLSTIVITAVLGGLAWNFTGRLSMQEPVDDDDIDFRELAFPIMRWSLLAGALGALCGIGGGMVMGPILVELKVPPPVSTATTATTLLVLSSSTLAVYLVRGVAPPDYALCLSLFTMCGAMTGKVLVGSWVRRTGKQSIIVWALAGVTVLSTILMGVQGLIAIRTDLAAALHFRTLCQSFPTDAVPSPD